MRGRTLARAGLGIGLVAALALGSRAFPAVLPTIPARVAALGAWGPVLVAVLYALATVALLPVVLLTLLAGALFGVAWATAVVSVGATVGAVVAFLVARYVARDAVARFAARSPRFAAVDRAIGQDGLTVVLLLRLSPLFPFVLLNYALGLTTVRFRDFLVGSAGMLPLILLYTYLGQLAGEVVLLAGGRPRHGTLEYAALALGLGVTGLATWHIARRARAALAQRID